MPFLSGFKGASHTRSGSFSFGKHSPFKAQQGAFKAIIIFALASLVVMTLSRVGLSLWQFDRVNDAQGWSHLLLQGLRVDLASLCWLFGIAALGTALFSGGHSLGKLWTLLLRLWLTLGLWLVIFLEASSPAFIEEYGFRPNRLYIEYLIYPKEVLSMLWAGRKFELLLSVIISGLSLSLGWYFSGKFTRHIKAPKWYWRPVLAVLVVALTLAGARSTLGHRPLNPAMVAFSDDPLVNSLVLNSSYSLFFAIKQMGSEQDASKVYGKMDIKEVIDIIRRESGRDLTAFNDDTRPSMSFNRASYQGKPKNLVIILEESLGARFVGNLGGLPLTPNIDALASQAWNFENLYATGTRSVRGIEAVVTGFTPTPARSVVKLGKSQTGFFTLAGLLKGQGYTTQFIYGGESHFDNMRSFFLGNGFSDIVDQNDYDQPSFEGSWGVSDEDLMAKAHDEFEQLTVEGKPFFSLVFSSSNHDPFEFPDNKIELYEQPKQTRNNAAKYADHAVGEFFKKAKASNYWKDTLFLVVADHDSRVGGADLVPIARFRIPGLILGDGINPKQDARVVSQIDLAPTLLSLMGISASYPMLGRDLTGQDEQWQGRALMQYEKNFALLEGERVTILQPEKAPMSFVYDFSKQTLTSTEMDPAQANTALSWALWGSAAYNQQWFTLAQENK